MRYLYYSCSSLSSATKTEFIEFKFAPAANELSKNLHRSLGPKKDASGKIFVFLYFSSIFILLSRENDRSVITSSLRSCQPPVYHTKMGESR